MSYRTTKVGALRDFFLQRPNEWVDGRQLEPIAGRYAWRTRVSDLRLKLGMVIENRLVRDTEHITSEYRYVPAAAA